MSHFSGRRPTIRHHYRAQKLALWLDLIPKINKDDGSDPSSHFLDSHNNASTFDDYHRLVPEHDKPGSASSTKSRDRPGGDHENGGAWTTQSPVYSDITDGGDGSDGFHKTSRQNGIFNGTNCPYQENIKITQTAETPNSESKGATTSGVPLSIVIAIGSSLLLINILIFAGLCYQRERIRKMRLSKALPPSDLDFEEARFRKMESCRSSPCPTSSAGPECVSLMSGTSTHKHPSPIKHSHHGNSHVHMPSPQPSTHSKRGHSQPRATPPLDSVTYNYSAVPTHVTSPVHRTHIPVSQGGSPRQYRPDSKAFVNNKVRPPMDAIPSAVNDHRGAVGVGGVSTFTTDHHPSGTLLGTASASILSNQALGVASGSGEAPVSGVASVSSGTAGGTGTKESSDPLYKTINKSGQNNAVTIV